MTRPAVEKIPPLTYGEYVAELRFFCRQRGLSLRRLGAVSGYDLLMVSGGAARPRRTLVFCGGIHGDEISGPLAILELVRRFDRTRLRRIRVILLPVANPWGFDHGRRNNAAGRNLNRGFRRARLTGESRLLHGAVAKARPDLFLSLHEDDVEPSLYMYAYGDHGQASPVRQIIKTAGRRHLPLSKSRRIERRPVSDGVIFNVDDGSFEHRVRLDGAVESICLELPDRRPLVRRIKAAVAVMSSLVRHYEDQSN